MSLKAGSSSVSITPSTTQFLDGYPLGRRFSTGIDTDIYCSALYLESGSEYWLILGLDLLFIDKGLAQAIRSGIQDRMGLSANRILVAATHTHSAPVAREPFPFYTDDLERHPDPAYIEHVINSAIACGIEAINKTVPAEIGSGMADSSEVGGNRRFANGIADSEVPILGVRIAGTNCIIAILLVVNVHPTVLHEDSTLVSADFPGYARKYLQRKYGNIPVVYLTGAAGNQSPRYFARANTVQEANRLGGVLADSVSAEIESMSFAEDAVLGTFRTEVAKFPFNSFPDILAARQREESYHDRFQKMKREGADAHATRTAETDWYGATRLRQLAELKASGDLERGSISSCLPVEIQVLQVGDMFLVAWPGEVFVEYALKLRRQFPMCRIITYANGNTQGYLVTAEAVEEGGYEASAATFKSPESPQALLEATVQLLGNANNFKI